MNLELKPYEQPENNNQFASREEIEVANKRADSIPASELPFNKNGELNNENYSQTG